MSTPSSLMIRASSWKCLSSSCWKRVIRILSSTVGAYSTHCPKTSAVATSRLACLSISVSTIFRYASSGISSFERTIIASLLIEHQNGSGHLAGLHGTEGLVDVLELPAPRDHLVELQAALPVELDVARHVDLEAIAAHAAALDLLLAQEHRSIELHLLPNRDHADDGGRTAGPDAVEALLGGELQPDGLEGVVDAAAGHGADRLDGILAFCVHGVRRAKLSCLGELR